MLLGARRAGNPPQRSNAYTTSRMTDQTTHAIVSIVKRTAGPERKRIKEMKGFTVLSSSYVLYLSLLLLRSEVLLACENTPTNQWRK